MSYITEIETIFKSYEADGTFGFRSDFEMDNKVRNIAAANMPLCFIEDNTTGVGIFKSTGDLDDTPTITVYFLTKYDSSGNQVTKDLSKVDKHTKCVDPMKTLGFSVLYQYYKQKVVVQEETKPNLPYEEIFDWNTSQLNGVKFTVNIKRFLSLTCP
jgi:hypothetical protein